ncbi:MAG: putative porin, partial [Proteobacteria bacterium]|nr:putative porin [Pseudomonadota bacterium]
MKRLMMVAALALGLCMLPSTWAAAATQAELEAKIKAMEQTLQEMKAQLGQVQHSQQQQQQAVEAAAANKLPSWVERITFFGDVRFRYEHTSYDELNGTDKSDRDRFRVRLRFGARSQIHPDVELGMRMTLGADDDPTSTNQTMGNYFGEYSNWGIDQAYVQWTPS